MLHRKSVIKDGSANVRMVNGRLVSKTLADPDLKSAVTQAGKTMFASKEEFIKEMARRGVLTPSGKLTKQSGG
jgi:hypothetical protein